MSRKKAVGLLVGGCLVSVIMAPGLAAADGLIIPGLGMDQSGPRPAYNQAVFPPPQHNILGLPARTPQPYDRPSYRETYNDFPPPGGRYGGGILEYVITGGRPEPVPPPVYAQPAYGQPAYAQPYASTGFTQPPSAYAGTTASPLRASLPRGGLPDYSPQTMGDGSSNPYAQPASIQPAYAQPPYAQQGYAPATSYNAPGSPYDPLTANPGLAARPINPIYNRQMVAYSGRERAGTIIIDTPDKFLYLVQGNGQAIRYGIGVGRPGFAWSGVKAISRKAEWPGWTPPGEMLKRRPDLPRHMVGGEANPLGARALYLGSSLYRIHGTNEPYTIGTNVSSGCIRMMNQDVIDLYGRVGVGTRVMVL